MGPVIVSNIALSILRSASVHNLNFPHPTPTMSLELPKEKKTLWKRFKNLFTRKPKEYTIPPYEILRTPPDPIPLFPPYPTTDDDVEEEVKPRPLPTLIPREIGTGEYDWRFIGEVLDAAKPGLTLADIVETFTRGEGNLMQVLRLTPVFRADRWAAFTEKVQEI